MTHFCRKGFKIRSDIDGQDLIEIIFSGPWAHLFHRVHEQSYVAHVIAFSARIGHYAGEAGDNLNSYSEFCQSASALNASSATIAPNGMLFLALVVAVNSLGSMMVTLSRGLF